MSKSLKYLSLALTILIWLFSANSKSEIINKIEIIGNDRIPSETIKMFANINVQDKVDDNKINIILKDLYETNFFENISIKIVNNLH